MCSYGVEMRNTRSTQLKRVERALASRSRRLAYIKSSARAVRGDESEMRGHCDARDDGMRHANSRNLCSERAFSMKCVSDIHTHTHTQTPNANDDDVVDNIIYFNGIFLLEWMRIH